MNNLYKHNIINPIYENDDDDGNDDKNNDDNNDYDINETHIEEDKYTDDCLNYDDNKDTYVKNVITIIDLIILYNIYFDKYICYILKKHCILKDIRNEFIIPLFISSIYKDKFSKWLYYNFPEVQNEIRYIFSNKITNNNIFATLLKYNKSSNCIGNFLETNKEERQNIMNDNFINCLFYYYIHFGGDEINKEKIENIYIEIIQ